MFKGTIKYIIALALAFVPTIVDAQMPMYDPITGKPVKPVGEAIDYRSKEEIEADEAKNKANQDTTKKRERKPLESFYFDDSTRMTKIFAWKVNPAFNSIARTPIDTLLLGSYQIDYKFMEIDGGIGSAYLGNLGSATIPLNYFSRSKPRNFSFIDVFRSYILRPEDVLFYNARTPYSRLTYSMSGEVKIEENLFNIILSHNISPSTSVNVVYNGDGTNGMYMHQRTLDYYLGLSVAHTGKRYAIHGGYIYNGGEIRENGGVTSDKMITDTVMSKPDQVEVRLKNARNKYIGHTFWWTQSYGIPLRKQRADELTIQKIPTIYIGQSFDYSLFWRTYKAKGDTALFKNTYIDSETTSDSVAQQLIDVKFFMQLQPYNRDGAVGLISAGIGNEFSAYFLNVPWQMRDSVGFGGRMNRNTVYVYGGIEGKISRYVDWSADARFNLTGYRAGDLDVQGKIRFAAYTRKKQQPISLDAGIRFSLTEPDFWSQSYFSNHFAWSNNFIKEVNTEISARLSFEPIKLYLGANYAITQNKVYFDEYSLPAQFSGTLNVIGVYLQKDFRIGGFHFNHRVLFQYSSNRRVAPVPMLSAYLSYFFRFDVVRNVLNVEIGLDGRYQTRYYGFGYNPAIAQFYNQREVELGGHPYVDAFVSAKWKRLRILVKLQHWNENLFGGRDYFMVAHYPQNRLMLKFKFSWSFYD